MPSLSLLSPVNPNYATQLRRYIYYILFCRPHFNVLYNEAYLRENTDITRVHLFRHFFFPPSLVSSIDNCYNYRQVVNKSNFLRVQFPNRILPQRDSELDRYPILYLAKQTIPLTSRLWAFYNVSACKYYIFFKFLFSDCFKQTETSLVAKKKKNVYLWPIDIEGRPCYHKYFVYNIPVKKIFITAASLGFGFFSFFCKHLFKIVDIFVWIDISLVNDNSNADHHLVT